MSVDSKILQNIRAHDRIARKYERTHGEIYNPVEQARLQRAIEMVLSMVRSTQGTKRVLDFGCGAGNLTSRFAQLGHQVLATDVSKGFLDLVASKRFSPAVETLQLNGSDLSNVPSASMDVVCAYSVLHHVPDYLGILKEFARVLRPGGIIYIDHEAASEVWTNSSAREDFLSEYRKSSWRWRKYLRFAKYRNWFMQRFVDPRYRSEGDIHVFSDDHIEWDRVKRVLQECGVEVAIEEDYLLFRRGYTMDFFDRHRAKTADTHMLIAIKA